MTTEPQAQPAAAPERIWRTTNGYIYKGPTPEPCVEYVRADLPRAAADALNEIEVALISIADGVSPHDAVQKAFDVINRERLAANSIPRAETGLTVEAALAELREMFGHGVYVMVEDRRIQYPEDVPRDPLRMARVHIDRNEFWANTLEATMQQVRAWAKSRAERERESDGS